MKAKIKLDTDRKTGTVDRRLFGSFIEHAGRAVYGGIYEPEHETADENGFRQDVLTVVRMLGVPAVRYPGGNFVSGYNWEDGTGEKSLRPKKLDIAWMSVETNQFGIDEFQKWAKLAGAEIIMTLNLGTRGIDEARQLLEYCNGTEDTFYAEKRRQNGFDEPFGIKLWCLGNELDGKWQIGAKTASEYAKLARETAKAMKWTDDSIELILCGSSSINMKTFGEWEYTVLKECYEYADYISLHNYYKKENDDTAEFLACSLEMDRQIKTVAAVCDVVKAELMSDKQMYLSFDEWNIWYRSDENDRFKNKWQTAPSLLEEKYTMEDALVLGCLLITLINNCGRVKIACLAQLVNALAPIMTQTGGGMWCQTIFYPYMHVLKYTFGTALSVHTECKTYDTEKFKNVPYIETAAVHDDDRIVLFAVNRSGDDCAEVDIDMPDGFGIMEHIVFCSDDITVTNDMGRRNVFPVSMHRPKDIILPPYSWNVIIMETDIDAWV